MYRPLNIIVLFLFSWILFITHANAQPSTVTAGPVEHAIVSYLRYSPDGKLLVAGFNGFQNGNLTPVEIRVWEVETGRQLWKRIVATNWITTLQFSPNSERIAYTGIRFKDQVREASQAQMWNARDGELITSLETGEYRTIWASTFTPDGTQVVGLVSRQGAPGEKAILKIWDAANGKELSSQNTDYTLASSIHFSADGKTLFVLALQHEDNSWPMSRGVFYSFPECQITNTINMRRMGAERSLLLPDKETVVVSGIVVNDQNQAPDGRGLTEYEIGLWDAATGKQKLVLTTEPTPNHQDTLILSPSGRQIIGSGIIRIPQKKGAIHIWDSHSGDLQHRLEIPLQDEKIPLSFLWAGLSPDGRQIAVPVASDKIELRNLQDGTLIRAFE